MPTVIPVPDNWQSLFDDWDEIRNGYYAGDEDDAVRDCVRRLEAAAAAGDPALFWTLGLLMLSPYVAFGDPAPETGPLAVAALGRVAGEGDGTPCTHAWHPYEADVDDLLEHLPTCMDVLGSPRGRALDDLLPEDLLPGLPLDALGDEDAEPAHLTAPDILARWQCPRTAPGFARAALDYLGAPVA
ncbi:hypothetical protein [Streptomyces sp. NPDC057682]|uniref:hypothetical protein n=1 Tax=Streptomyces sp. NPDC057682 TaxID=3346210 RepID=UPI0036B9D7F1